MNVADTHDPEIGDSVDSILDVAGEVLSEYYPDDADTVVVLGSTRIERLARWVIQNIDPLLYDLRDGAVSAFEHPAGVRVLQCADKIAVEFPKFVTPDQARIAATLLLRAAERADEV